MKMNNKKLIAFDLDGTLSQHRTPVPDGNIAVLRALSEKYKLIMVGAGNCNRIWEQLGRFPIDIIGCYGMEYAEYDDKTGTLPVKSSADVPCDRESIISRCATLRERYGYTEYAGDSVVFHKSGAWTFALLGSDARIEDKLVFDPTRAKRKLFYDDVKATFPDYTVFLGGSSSFDMAPAPYDKYYALDSYCRAHGLAHSDVVFFGDDTEPGGNDYSVYSSDFDFVKVDDYTKFPEYAKFLL